MGKDTAFDLVIMDLTIPNGMGGKAAAAKILRIYPSARIALRSGHLEVPVMSNPKAFDIGHHTQTLQH